MKSIKLVLPFCFLFLSISSCYEINSETSQIGDIPTVCLSKNAWAEIQKENSINNIKDPIFNEGLKYVQNHFIKPEYVVYFEDEPKEIVGCDYYSIRVVYNPNLADFELDGLSPQLNDKEQVRIRNRILDLVKNYECKEGRIKIINAMNEPSIFSKEYYDKR